MLRSRAHTAYLLLSLTTLFWAGNAIVARALYASIPPVGFAFWRWVVASAMVLPFAWPRLRTDWRALALIVGGFVLFHRNEAPGVD